MRTKQPPQSATSDAETNWIALMGQIEINEEGEICFTPPEPPDTSAQTVPVVPHSLQSPFATIKSNKEFEKGEISFEVKIEEQDSRCQLILNQGNQPEIFVGINVVFAAYGFALARNNMFEQANHAGFGSKPPIDQWISVRLTAKGSIIDLFINGVKVCSYSEKIIKAQISFFIQGNKPIKIRNLSVKNDSPECFVVMQFTDEFNHLYNEAIKPVCQSFGLEVIRADENHTAGLIIEDITKSIKESSVIIADITPNNPNVFYEVGYAHGIGKPTILLSDRKRDKLPFDVSGFRTLFYDNTIAGKRAIEEGLRKHLENILQ